MNTISRLVDQVGRTAQHLDFTNAAIIVLGVVVIGCICMRGFGSQIY